MSAPSVPFPRIKPFVAVLLTATSLQACAPVPVLPNGPAGRPAAALDPCLDQSAQQVGRVAGAVLGGLLAKQFSNSKNAMPVGIVLGAALGQAIGKDISRRRCELSNIAKKHALEMHTLELRLPSAASSDGPGSSVGISAGVVDKGGSEGQFLPGSDTLTPSAKAYFAEIASTYTPQARLKALGAQQAAELKDAKILVVGHTDDQEDSRAAADLSERRARAVARVFREAGIPEQSIYFQGAGETLPVADNNTEKGRAANRRVEIVDVANDSVMASYLASRVSTSSYFRSVAESAVPPRAQMLSEAHPGMQIMSAKARKGGTGAAAIPRPAETIAMAGKDRQGLTEPPQPSSASARPGGHRADTGGPGKPTAVTRPPVAQRAESGEAAASASMRQPGALDLGGSRFNPANHQISVGDPLHSSGFSLIPVARASEVPLQACVDDRPRIAHSVKSLSTGRSYRIGDYQPGAFGTSWSGRVNGHLVSLTNVAVIRAGGLPANDPGVMVFKNFSEKGGVARKPDFTFVPTVNTYAGTRGTLYRVFFEKGTPLRCIDVLLPPAAPFRVERGYVYQDRNRQTFASEYKPEIAPSALR